MGKLINGFQKNDNNNSIRCPKQYIVSQLMLAQIALQSREYDGLGRPISDAFQRFGNFRIERGRTL